MAVIMGAYLREGGRGRREGKEKGKNEFPESEMHCLYMK